MFSALEDEVITILRANLSPAPLPADRVVAGPIGTPPISEFPTVAFTAHAFEVLPSVDVGPPRGAKTPVEESFAPDGGGPFPLSRPPIEPLRAVEVVGDGGADRTLLRERDDYIVDYVNAHVRLRRAPAGSVAITYFALEPLQVEHSIRLRVDCRLEVFAERAPGEVDDLTTIATLALAALAGNAGAFDGLVTDKVELASIGGPSAGAGRAFLVFDGLRAVGGLQPQRSKWEMNYAVEAMLVLVPAEDGVGLIRHVAAGVAWDDRIARFFLSATPPILGRSVIVIRGAGAATAARLAERGVTTVGELADARFPDAPDLAAAGARARTVREEANGVVRRLVAAAPTIPDVAAFMNQRLDQVEAGDLTAVGIPDPAAGEIVAALAALLAATSAGDLRLADLFAPA